MKKLLYLLFISFYSHALWSQEIVITDDDLQGNETYNWTKDNTYLLDGLVYLEEGGVLNIEAGTVIRGQQFPNVDDVTALIISRGAQLNAIGTVDEPIIFTAEDDDLSRTQDIRYRDRGLWGGILILGKAPIIEKFETVDVIKGLEGVAEARYGGDDIADNSGTLEYVSIRHAGAGLSPNDLISGLTLAGVGNGTRLNHIEIFASAHGGLDILGGTAELKYIVSVINADNSFEYSHGWQGKGQFWFGINSRTTGDIGGAFKGGESLDPDIFSQPTISNATFLGSGCETNDPEDRLNSKGLEWKGNTGGVFMNNIIGGFKKAIEVEDFAVGVDARQRMEAGDLVIANNIFGQFCEGEEVNGTANGIIYIAGDAEDPTAQFLVDAFESGSNSYENLDISCINRRPRRSLNPLLLPNSRALVFGQPIDDPFFDAVSYIGAFDHSNNWMLDWTALDAYHFLGSCQVVSGQVVIDENGNCLADTLEQGFEGLIVALQGEQDTFYTQTDASGGFSSQIDTGIYNVHLTLPNTYWELCENDYTLTVTDTTSAIVSPFVISERIACPFLEVDVATPFLRRCFDNTYQISFCNTGTAAVLDAEVQLMLDPFFTFISSSIGPSSQEGLMFTFPIGDLAVGACGRFSVTINLSCDALLGQSHCVEANIFPLSNCETLPPSARLKVSGECVDEAIEFTVENIGEIDMSAPSQLIVIEDDVMFLTRDFQLEATTSESVMVIPSGRTIRIEAPRVPSDPSKGYISKTIEGCGENGEESFSTGFVNQFPLDEAAAHESVDCQENRGSFDPNDKQGFPVGYKAAKNIRPGTTIEYQVRFQNTGSDTAFTVLIYDTLSPNLDIGSIRTGASSHPYKWTLHDNILQFQFSDILLPDSTTNEAASHGFVKFKINPKLGIPLKSTIFNNAGIYFDFNEPVITNSTFHTIDLDFIEIPSVNSTQEGDEPLPYRFYPSPLKSSALLDLQDYFVQEGLFSVFNAQGQLLRQEPFTGNKFEFQRNHLSDGYYFFKVEDQGQTIITGKIIMH